MYQQSIGPYPKNNENTNNTNTNTNENTNTNTNNENLRKIYKYIIFTWHISDWPDFRLRYIVY